MTLKSRFLIADDDADDADLFCEALQLIAPAMICVKAENGKEVLTLLSNQDAPKPDIIFLDINMPIMNGWECLKRLKDDSKFRNIPVIMYSTSSSKVDIERAYQLGAVLFVSKPEEFHELHKILEILATYPQESALQDLRRFTSVKVA